MIFWIASYPKNGNTWLRSLLSAYYFTKNGNFINDKILKNIPQFPEKRYFTNFDYDKSLPASTAQFWIKAQEIINKEKKIKFFKTHNIYGSLNNTDFSNKYNSIGGTYIIRDPRNVITSLKNHYELNDDSALKWMLNENNYIYDVSKFKEDGYSDFQFISSWNTNFKSWRLQKKISIKIIKYEDLLNNTYSVFREVVEFINKTIKNNEKINKNKMKNSVNSTFFDKLKHNEKKNGFSEAVTSKTDQKKIPFFHLGPNNNWRKLLDKELQKKMTNEFKETITELGYD